MKERVRRANKLPCQVGHLLQETIIISIHVNAAGNGSLWMNARGWCAYTFPGHTESDDIADCLYLAAEKHLFMDNQEDCRFLLSSKGRQAIINLHIEGLIEYLDNEEPKVFRWPSFINNTSLVIPGLDRGSPFPITSFSLSLRYRIIS